MSTQQLFTKALPRAEASSWPQVFALDKLPFYCGLRQTQRLQNCFLFVS